MSNTKSSETPILVADIGGTNARFALAYGAMLTQQRTFLCAEYPDLVDVARAYLASINTAKPQQAAFAVAAPIVGDQVDLTNNGWRFSVEETKQALALAQLVVLNDFTALALSLPHLPQDALRQIGGGESVGGAALGLIGAGTGTGVSGLIPTGSGWAVIQGEGGHCTFSPSDAYEADILRIVWRDYPHVSTERLISGIGLTNIHRALAELQRVRVPALAPEHITEHALAGDGFCASVMNLFCGMLGTAAGNLALTLGARGGMYIGGGIVPRLGNFFDRSPFRAHFEAKGRYASYLTAIPTYLIVAPDATMLGAAQALLTNQR